ncbi:MAG: hypothetical protein ACFB2Y_16870 [Fulvivirga sp.]
MKFKKQLSEENLNELGAQLKQVGISKKDLAKKSGKSYRAVCYFFNGHSCSQDIHKAAIQMLDEVLDKDIYTIQRRHSALTKLRAIA